MLRNRDRVIGALPALVLVATAIVAIVLLRGAERRGVEALEHSASAEVGAIARSQNQRLESTLSGTAGLANNPYELTPGSEKDLAELEELVELLPDLRSGFFLTDANLVVTQGVHLLDPDSIGRPYTRPGLEELVASESFRRGRGGLLPATKGITTTTPQIGLVFPIFNRLTGAVRGTFVFESEVSADSNFNAEIGQLSRGETGRYIFYDSTGVVLAANEDARIGKPLADQRLLRASPGLHDIDGDVVVVADVPAAGWHVAFLQDRGEFEEGLSGPLQTVGLIVVVVLLGSAAMLGVALMRRLAAAREEQHRLQQLADTQAEFISIVSHEVRTPVAGVLGFLQTTLDHWDAMSDAERLSAVRRAATNARRLQSMARDVLDTQALESGRMTFIYDEIDLAGEVRAAVDAARNLYEGRLIEVEAPAGRVELRADADRIHQVLSNLIDNAVKNSPPSEPVSVRLATNNSAAVLTVTDRGAGMSEDTRARVFDKFVRGQPDSVSGSGLGLYIAKEIVEAHKGSIDVESQPGAGATFTILLPIGASATT